MNPDIRPETFLSGANGVWLADMYQRFLQDPASVDPSWAGWFRELQDDLADLQAERQGPSWAPRGPATAETEAPAAAKPAPSGDQVRQATLDSLRALMLIRVYRVRGHLLANLDPLGLQGEPYHPELDYRTYGFTDADLDRPIFINHVLGLESASLRQILDILKTTYCGSIGVEFMHIQDPEQKAWIQERIETARNQTDFTERGKKAILERLTQTEVFERFLDKKFTGTKRFGLEGGESLIPALEQIVKRGAQLGLQEVALGMAHRGRLNVLANFLAKPFQAIFSEFQGNAANPEDVQGSGDVKYHLGTSADRDFGGHKVHLSLTANPSHLEAVDPVVLGKVRAKQFQRHDDDRTQVMAVLLHGDAAFAGQGLVAETMDLAGLAGYRTGGTLHFVINNQIGFTTSPTAARTGPYCSEVAKIIQAPILHVNGDDPEAVVHAARIATEFRMRFKHSVVIDMFCYRRHGHNESDEPSFTQPRMYKKIHAHPTTRQIYARQLVGEKVITEYDGDQMVVDFQNQLEREFEAAQNWRPNKADWLEGKWSGLGVAPGEEDRKGHTAVEMSLLHEVGRALTTPPEGFTLNSKIRRQLKAKQKMFETGQGFDWATGEALALGTLAAEGYYIRLSGQDCGRGTFSQRHAIWVDQETDERYCPIGHVRDGQGRVEIIDSPLSEASVLGFEYGYSMAEPHALVLWEAQFGDFANGAQIIIDNFISSAESKWLRMSGLVMLLPHGYEGQGPEHSSARPERYLQLCAEDNIQVVNCTTPANYFHALRRQLHRPFRKPLVVFTPKSLLRHKLCVSSLEAFGPGGSFHRLLNDKGDVAGDDAIRRVVLCSGKVYYDLYEERARREIRDVYLLRVEQLYPFPFTAMRKMLSRFPKADIVWCQEEPRNMGAWTFVNERLERVLNDIEHACRRPIYAGRPEAAAPATGAHRRHVQEQKALVDAALTLA